MSVPTPEPHKIQSNITASEIALQLTALIYQEERISDPKGVIEAYEKCLAAVKKGIEA